MKRFILSALPLLLILSACNQYFATPTPVPTTRPTETSMPPTPSPEPTATPEPTSTPITSVTLRRGVNMGNMLEAPNEGEWGLTVQEEYFDLIKDAGFDFIRLPVNWKAHSTHTGYDDGDRSYTIEPAFFARVDEVIDWALKRDLSIIIDLHNYEELMAEPNGEQFLFMWYQIAEHYKDYPPQVIFELLNEPHDKINADLWNEYIKMAVQVIREINPTRDIVVGPVNWNAYDSLSSLAVPNDEHLIVTFHYYEPFQFTHQGAEWVDGSGPWLGTSWDATDEQKAAVTSNFDSVSDWAKRHGNIRILLGEFGAYSKAPQDSRVRWTEFVRSEAERHGFAWAYWEFGAGFGMYDPNAKAWRADLLKALIP